MTRRSVFADKLREFAFVWGDDDVFRHAGQWRARFPRVFQRSSDAATLVRSPLYLEIGCNNADFLARVAMKHPQIDFVGVDWKARPLYLGAQHIAEQSLANIALLRARAQELDRVFAPGELDEIWLFHPDPFDSDKDRPMRLMSPSFLHAVSRVLRPGGRFVLKTDHREYFEATRTLLAAVEERFVTEVESADLWTDAAAQRHAAGLALSGETTLFEQRFIRRHQPIHFISVQARA